MTILSRKKTKLDPGRQERVQLMALMCLRLGVGKQAIARQAGYPSWASLVSGQRTATERTEGRLLDLLRVAVNNSIATLQDVAVVGSRHGAEAEVVARCRDIAARPLSILAHQVGTELSQIAEGTLDNARCMANIDPEARERMRAEGRELWREPTPEEAAELDAQMGGWGAPSAK